MDELVKKAECRHGYVRKRKVPIPTAELDEIYSPVPSPDFKHYNFNFYQTVYMHSSTEMQARYEI